MKPRVLLVGDAVQKLDPRILLQVRTQVLQERVPEFLGLRGLQEEGDGVVDLLHCLVEMLRARLDEEV